MKIVKLFKLFCDNAKLFYINLSLLKKKYLSHTLLYKEKYLSRTFLYKASMELMEEEEYEIQVLPLPDKALCDKKEYRVIRLENGLTALLISDRGKEHDDPGPYFPPTNNEEENESNDDEEDMEDDGDGEEDEGEEEEEEVEEEAEEETDEGIEDMPEVKDENPVKKKIQTRYLSAASLCIGVGHLENPKEIQGLMHFLEHMVFMGSEKYPKENCFDNFVKKCGGCDNAHTDYENTTFYFEVQEMHFHKALDMFAQFFISPLMKKEAMQRERKSVHSEFQDSVDDDDCRREKLLANIANPDHPISFFNCGNEKTLQLNISDEELHSKLHHIRKKYYSAQYMTLVIQTRESIMKMEEMVVEIFAEIPNNGLPRIQYKSLGFPFSVDNFHKFYKVIPVNDKHTLDINWVLPPLLKYYHCKPLQYISFFFGHEGHGSIISFLKKKVWAVDICAGNDESGFERNSICEFFNIRIHLTDEGFRNLKDVLRTVFQYLDMVKRGGPNKRIFEEIQKIEQIDFDYAEDKNPTENVVDLSEAMQLYPTKHILTGPNLLFQYDPYIIRSCLDQMNIRNCNIMLSSQKFENEDLEWEVEEFFQTKFCVEDIPEEWLQEFESACLNYLMHLPFANDFIPDNFYVHKWTNPDSIPPRFPENIVRNSNGRLWFKQDFKFNLPRAYCYMYYYFDDIRKSAEMAAMLDLFLNLFNQHIMEALYPANMAQYYTKMRAADWGFTVKINGFNQKLFKCLETILSQIEDFEKCLDDKTFEEMKQQQLKTYHNYTLSPDVLRRDLRLLILQEVHWPVIEKMKALQNIEKEHFLSTFMRKVINNRYVKMLVQGNITADEAKNLFDLAVRNPTPNLECKPKCPEMRIRRCKAGEHVIRIKSLNSTSPNSTLVNYYQGERGCLRSELINEFVIMAMDEPVFDTLRTKDQLGYHVYCTNRNTYGILGISITVNSQADKYSSTYVHERMESFLKLFMENLKNISNEEMENLRETLKNFKLTVDITLKEEMDRNWGEIISEKYLFSRFDQQLPLIPTITLEEVCAYLHKIANKSGNSDFRKLSVQIVGSSESTKEALPTCESTLKKPVEEILTFLPPTEDDPKSAEYISNIRQYCEDLSFLDKKKVA